MSHIVHYTNCPVCGSEDFHKVFTVKDYTVSAGYFVIEECTHCSLRFTQDVPDEQSIGQYYLSEDYISHSNTAKGLINRVYHFVRKRTLAHKRKLIQKATGLSKGCILDLGCGTGSFVSEMKLSGWDVTGLEPDPGARKLAKEMYELDIAGADEFYRLPAEGFDAITLWHVLEHVHDPEKYIRQLKKILKEKGRIFIAVPNYTSLDAAIYKEAWAAYDVPRHLYHFSPRSMDLLMKKHDLKILAYKPMWYDSFYISLLSSKYKNGKSGYISATLNGLRSNMAAFRNIKKCSSLVYIIGK